MFQFTEVENLKLQTLPWMNETKKLSLQEFLTIGDMKNARFQSIFHFAQFWKN